MYPPIASRTNQEGATSFEQQFSRTPSLVLRIRSPSRTPYRRIASVSGSNPIKRTDSSLKNASGVKLRNGWPISLESVVALERNPQEDGHRGCKCPGLHWD